jgi:hypothetical protein
MSCQFPDPRCQIGPASAGMALDFKHFFSGYMNMANGLGCVPSTGTLSLIRVSALLMSVGRFLVYWVWWQTHKTLQITADLWS